MRRDKAGATQTRGAQWLATLVLALLVPAWTALASAAGAEP